MRIQMVGCTHHRSSIEVRERLAFNTEQAGDALSRLRTRFPATEAVLLSTCNRVELYTAAENAAACPSHHDLVDFFAGFHGVPPVDIFDELLERTGEDVVRHLFMVAASLDSMVVGESQILAQVKQAYDLATSQGSAGPLTHAVFQAAIRVAKRVSRETEIAQKRVSIPSIAVTDFAKSVFERFDDKQILVVGAGEMAEETLTYLVDEGARDIVICNRSFERSQKLADRFQGKSAGWDELPVLLTRADLVVGATGAPRPVVTLDDYRRIEHDRFQRLLFVLDLGVPRDFDPAIGECLGVYLYSLDDLQAACDRNRKSREREWPKAERIIDEETRRFMAELHHRATGPTIKRLKARAEELKTEELARLLNKLPGLDVRSREEIERAFERLVNKLLHPPLESLRDEAQEGTPHGLLEALKRLFQLKD